MDGSGNQAVHLASNKTTNNVATSRKSISYLVLSVVVVVLLCIYFVYIGTNDINITIDKQQDKSVTDENLIEQIPDFTYTVNTNQTTFIPLSTMNPNTQEKLANINTIINVTVTNLTANTNKHSDDIKQLQDIKNNATYLIFHRLSKTGTSTFMAICRKYSLQKYNIKYVQGLDRIRKINSVEEIGAYRPISNDILSRYMYGKLKYCYRAIQNNKSRFTRCFINTQMPFIDNFEKMAKVTHLEYSPNMASNMPSNPFTNGKIQFMTFIRNPMTRIQSFYYYIRGIGGHFPQQRLEAYHRKIEKHKKNNLTDPVQYPEAMIIRNITKNYTFVQCIEDIKRASNELVNTTVLSYDVQRVPIHYEQLPRLDVCRLSMNYVTQYYCGIDAIDCHPRHLTNKSLDKALYNLDTYFSFVGLFEQYDIALKLVYKKFSYLFDEKKMTDLETWSIKVKEAGDNFAKQQKYGTVKHDKMSETDPLWIYLTSKNHLDMKLYQHVKQRFEQIVDEYGLQ